MNRIDNIQARCDAARIEIGLFEGEECREVVALRAPEAFELRDSLNDALREAGLLNRKTAASEQHAVELLEVARDVVCARTETVDPVRFYDRMNTVADRAQRAVEAADRANGRRMSPAERAALAARPWLDVPQGTGVAAGKTESSIARAARELVTALEGLGFGCDDVEINGGAAVDVINDHLPALREALSEEMRSEEYDAHLSQQEQEHYRQLEGCESAWPDQARPPTPETSAENPARRYSIRHEDGFVLAQGLTIDQVERWWKESDASGQTNEDRYEGLRTESNVVLVTTAREWAAGRDADDDEQDVGR